MAIVADIEQAFYRFRVDEDHLNNLRFGGFFWYKDSNPDDIVIKNTEGLRIYSTIVRRLLLHRMDSLRL